MLIGYARVSTTDQDLSLQKDALEKAGCENIYTDTISGAKRERPGLDEILKYARDGDVILVWRLDRLGRSLRDLIEIVQGLEARGVGLKSLQESIDTTTSGGKFVFQVFGALAEFERNLIRERTKAGLEAARARGRLGGRPNKLNKEKIDRLNKLYESKEYKISEICEMLDVSKGTVYTYLKFNQ